jgi:hypothetical protein
MGRVLKPAARACGIGEWVGFHTFRHTCATMLFRQGWNAPQVQRFLGHSDPGFTPRRYVHLLDDDLPTPGFFDALVAVEGGKRVAKRQAETTRELPAVAVAESA